MDARATREELFGLLLLTGKSGEVNSVLAHGHLPRFCVWGVRISIHIKGVLKNDEIGPFPIENGGFRTKGDLASQAERKHIEAPREKSSPLGRP
jgi:hypothetical protein